MIARVWRAVLKFFGSARLALVLLTFLGLWSAVATAVPQGDATAKSVAEWAAENAAAERVVDALGLHQAFGAPLFLGAAILLAISTLVCSVARTRAAVARSGQLREARGLDAAGVAAASDFSVACAPGMSAEVCAERAADALADLGIKTRRDGAVLRSISPLWAVWGSPVFHWSLLALMLAVALGGLVRAEGTMALAVGDAKPDGPESYVTVDSGPWHQWDSIDRAIRVDAFDPAYEADGMVRGAVPTVSVLDAAGEALVTKAVYANSKLHLGSLSVHAPDCGLVVRLAILDEAGQVVTRPVQFVDFSQEAEGGTVPMQPLALKDRLGNVVLRMIATVPLDTVSEGGYGEWIPDQPSALVRLVDGGGVVLAEGSVSPGTDLAIEGGGVVRLVDIGWYSRLVVVDDPTVPLVYATMLLALLGLTMSLVTPHRLLVVAVVEGEQGPRAHVRVRFWRNNPTTRDELRTVLTAAYGDPHAVDEEDAQ